MSSFAPCITRCFRQMLMLLCLCVATYNGGLAQSVNLICYDTIFVSLDESCSFDIAIDMIVSPDTELSPGGSIDSFLIDIDKTPPIGNGPWEPAVVTSGDLGELYRVRVRDPFTANLCWCEVKVLTHLDCSNVTTINLDASGHASLAPADLQTGFSDACVPANTISATKINNQNTLSLDCSDLGMNALQLTASDQNGNTSYCSASVLVTDPFEVCDTCLVCPPAAFVSYDEAVLALLPALQSGDFTLFDAYGQPEQLSACTFSDTNYTVSYHPSPSQQSWFVRRWEGLDASGTVIGACEQSVIFDFRRFIGVNGFVFIDSIQNCLRDAVEYGFSAPKVRATRLPSNYKVTKTPDATGAYSFNLESHGSDSIIIVEMLLPNGITTPCPNIFVVPVTDTVSQYTTDFGAAVDTTCHSMEISLDMPIMRRCFESTYYVRYCNHGFQPAENAAIVIAFDPLLHVVSSEVPWTDTVNNRYTFPLGTVPPFFCRTFTVKVLVDCDAVLEQTLCSEAVIYPNEICGNLPWGGPNIETSAHCENDSVKLIIRNTGDGDMNGSLNFIVIEDIIMYRTGEFQLDAGDSTVIAVEANGATWRIEAEQDPGNPVTDMPSSSIEACGGLNTPGLINAFSHNDDALYIDRSCKEVRGSFDPNDKSAVPTGYTEDHIIRENTDIEYRIRFQNTGTDTAFKVVVIDTLSQNLDFASLEAGVSSHPYQLKVYEGGILHFVFYPIMLPDSNVNEPASHGFLNFRIAQKKDLAPGTQILNTAHIYFDFNEAVVTNTVLHTIGAPFIKVNTGEAREPAVSVSIQPNPMWERCTLSVKGEPLQHGRVMLRDALGRSVLTKDFEGNHCIIERRGLNEGLYFLQIDDGGKLVSNIKITILYNP